MKIVIAGLAAAMLAAPLLAQTVTPVEPGPPAPMENAVPAPQPGTEIAALIEKDGKWWNGDREATPAEIAAYKKAQKPK